MGIGHFLLFVCFRYELWGYYVPIIVIATAGLANLSIAPLAWVVMSEIFPTRVRGKAMAFSAFVVFGSCFLNIQIFPMLQEFFERTIGTSGGVFFVYAVICLLGFFFIWRIVPETKGRSLEEISHFWLSKTKSAE